MNTTYSWSIARPRHFRTAAYIVLPSGTTWAAFLSGSFMKILVLQWAKILSVYAIWMMMTYLTDVWKIKFTHAAMVVNIYYGAVYIMPLGVAYLALARTGNYWMLLSSSVAYSIGMGFLWMSTPPVLSKTTGTCSSYQPECIGDVQRTLFYTALPLIVFGFVGHSVSCPGFYIEHIIERDQQIYPVEGPGKQKAVGFLIIVAVMLAPVTGGLALPYISPWSIRFGIPAICTLVATLMFIIAHRSYVNVKPVGFHLPRLFQVLVGSILKMRLRRPRDLSQLYEKPNIFKHTSSPEKITTWNKAAIVKSTQPLEEQQKSSWTLCSVTDVEEIKVFLRLIPHMVMTVIPIGLVLSLGNTFFLEQVKNMNPNVGKLKVPLPIFLILYGMISYIVSGYYKRITNGASLIMTSLASETGMIVSMVLATLCCITAAKVEERRISVIKYHNLLDKPEETIPMTMFWLLPQFLLLGATEGLVRATTESLRYTRASFMIYFIDASLGTGILGASLFAFIVDKGSTRGGKQSWFGATLNSSQLDNYYWTLAALSAINIFVYVFIFVLLRLGDDPKEETTAADDEVVCCCC
ncbi:hypothetical protein ACHQM5_022241 [Ranunculus cassubicifolius]